MKPTDRSPHASASGPGHHYDAAELHNEGVAHEHSDIKVRAIVVFLVALAVIGITVHILMWGLFVVFERQAEANDRPQSAVALPATQMPRTTTGSPSFGTAAKPQLLTNEPRALELQRRDENQQLTNYGWVDQKSGIARVPIDEAKKLIVERGLPTRSEKPIAPELGTTLPSRGESSSGRLVTPPRRSGTPEAGAASSTPQQTTPVPPAPRKPGGGHN